MIDEKTMKVYEALRSVTGEDGAYKIVEATEIADALPEGSEMSKFDMSVAIRALRDDGLIKVKYFTPDEYCLQTVAHREKERASASSRELPAVREEKETAEDASVNLPAVSEQSAVNVKPAKPVKYYLIGFAAFIGSLLGGGVVAAIAILLQKFAL